MNPNLASHPLNIYLPQPIAWQKTTGLVVITGGLGFIGSCLANFFMLAGQPILIVDDATPEKLLNITSLEPPYLLSQAAIKRPPTTPPIISPDEFLNLRRAHYEGQNIAAIIHLGAISDTRSKDEDRVFEKNTDFSEALWYKAAEWGVPFIYASSAATYGDGSAGFNEPKILDDLKKLKPLNLYGLSKQLFDLVALHNKEKEKKRIVERKQTRDKFVPPFFAGLKFFNVFGPGEYHKGSQASVIPRFYQQAITSQTIRLFKSTPQALAEGINNGEQARDFVWVMDAVWVIISLLQLYQSKKTSRYLDKAFLRNSSGIFNVGAGHALSFNELASFIIKQLPASAGDATINYIDTPLDLQSHYQHHTCASISNLQQLINFVPTDIDKAVGFYINDFLKPAVAIHKKIS